MGKEKARCEVCAVKLNLVDLTMGACKCELVFCKAHRLPESHACAFDFKRIKLTLPEAMVARKVVKL